MQARETFQEVSVHYSLYFVEVGVMNWWQSLTLDHAAKPLGRKLVLLQKIPPRFELDALGLEEGVAEQY